mgnify:CR=1 FL=1
MMMIIIIINFSHIAHILFKLTRPDALGQVYASFYLTTFIEISSVFFVFMLVVVVVGYRQCYCAVKCVRKIGKKIFYREVLNHFRDKTENFWNFISSSTGRKSNHSFIQSLIHNHNFHFLTTKLTNKRLQL